VWGPANGAYQPPPPDIIAKVNALQEVCKAHSVPLGAAALQFALTHPVVCSVLTGPKSPAELKGILDWWSAPIPSAFWHDLASKNLVAEGTPLPA
jgi:D-threo-aldose 1-dehydrogenase